MKKNVETLEGWNVKTLGRNERPATERRDRRSRRARCIVPLQKQAHSQDWLCHGTSREKFAGKDTGVPRNTYGEMARTRRGLPEPLTILRGAAMTTAPVGGN